MSNATKQLLLLILFRITRSISAGLIMLAFPYLILRVLRYGALELGFIYSTAAIATAFLGLLFGFLADTWGRKGTLVIVALMLPLSSALLVISSRLAVIYLASVIGGYSATGSLMGGGVGGASQPIQTAVIADLTTLESRTRYFSILTFLSGVFSAFGALLAKFYGIRETFLVATLIAAAGLLFLLPMSIPKVGGELRRMKSGRTIGKFTLTGVLNGFTQGLVTPFLIPFFVIVFHVPRSQMAVYAFASGVVASLSILCAPWLERRMGFVKSIVVTRGVGAALILILPFSHFLLLALAIYLVTPALRIMALPVQQTALTEMVGRKETGRALGINQVARLAASSGGIALTGSLFELSEIPLPFFIYSAVTIANLFLYFRFFRVNPVDDRIGG